MIPDCVNHRQLKEIKYNKNTSNLGFRMTKQVRGRKKGQVKTLLQFK